MELAALIFGFNRQCPFVHLLNRSHTEKCLGTRHLLLIFVRYLLIFGLLFLDKMSILAMNVKFGNGNSTST